MPILSIITINYNNLPGLRNTFNSVLTQTFNDYEYIIIDGGSIDGSEEFLASHASQAAYWVSEKDKGIYNAQNKGLSKATGDYVLFLNSGDKLNDLNTLKLITPFLDGTDIIYGDLKIVESTAQWVKKYNEKLTFGYFLRDTLPHQGSFIRRSIFDKTGFLDENFEICSDWKFFIEAVCRYNATMYYLDFVVSEYDYNGISSRAENRNKMHCEKQTILKKEFARFYEEYVEFLELKKNYPPLANSRFVKTYLKIRKLFT
jgi:glycosyltransferase involved in cell wall biosynthesis